MVQPDLLQCIPINIEIEYFMWYKNFLCLVQYFIPLILISGAYIRYLSTIIKEPFIVSSTTFIEVEIILFKIPKSCCTLSFMILIRTKIYNINWLFVKIKRKRNFLEKKSDSIKNCMVLFIKECFFMCFG